MICRKNILMAFAAAAAAAMLFWMAFFGKAEVYGNSMEPDLKAGQTVMVDKLSYQFREPERYEIVVFSSASEENRYYMKRIIGLPGETIQVKKGQIYVDGILLEEPEERELIQEARRAADPVILGPEEYFVLGDNRNNSSDSRDWNIGNVKKNQIIGRVVQ